MNPTINVNVIAIVDAGLVNHRLIALSDARQNED